MPTLYKWGSGLHPDQINVEYAEDEFLVTPDRGRIIDAAAGAAVVNLGHSLPEVSAVMADQADRVGYLSTTYFTADSVEALTEALEAISPADLDTVFYVNSGSEANESAFKLARMYHAARGHQSKTKIIGRWQSYHGSTLGALAASGSTARRKWYHQMFPHWPHVPPAYPYRWDYRGTLEQQSTASARELEKTIQREGPETIAAFVAEPVAGSSIPAARPHPAYYEEVRRICDDYDVLFIADEVMTGFGRTGEMFAVDHFDVVPDMMTVGKGMSGGYAPISAVLMRDELAVAVDRDSRSTFAHGHTFSGNPISAAVAAHVVPQYTDDLLARSRALGERLVDELQPALDNRMVGELRSSGLLVGIEFVSDSDSKAPFDPDVAVHKRLFEAALERGVYTYPGQGCVDGVAGDHLMLAPPLTTSEQSIRDISSAVNESIATVARELRRDGALAP